MLATAGANLWLPERPILLPAWVRNAELQCQGGDSANLLSELSVAIGGYLPLKRRHANALFDAVADIDAGANRNTHCDTPLNLFCAANPSNPICTTQNNDFYN